MAHQLQGSVVSKQEGQSCRRQHRLRRKSALLQGDCNEEILTGLGAGNCSTMASVGGVRCCHESEWFARLSIQLSGWKFGQDTPCPGLKSTLISRPARLGT